jgi:hypothetical protein
MAKKNFEDQESDSNFNKTNYTIFHTPGGPVKEVEGANLKKQLEKGWKPGKPVRSPLKLITKEEIENIVDLLVEGEDIDSIFESASDHNFKKDFGICASKGCNKPGDFTATSRADGGFIGHFCKGCKESGNFDTVNTSIKPIDRKSLR